MIFFPYQKENSDSELSGMAQGLLSAPLCLYTIMFILLRSHTPVVFDTGEEIAGGKGFLLMLCVTGHAWKYFIFCFLTTSAVPL